MSSMYDKVNKIWKGPSIPYPFEMNFMVSDLVYQIISNEPNKIFQISEIDGHKITFKDLKKNCVTIAQNLLKNGIQADDVICSFLRQSNYATFVINGCILIGAIINPLEADQDEADIQEILMQTKPKIIICESDHEAKIQRILNKMELDVQVYLEKSFLEPTSNEDNFVVPKFSQPSNEKILVILCSSGTTGRPKGVCVSHADVLSWVPMMRAAKSATTSLCYSPIIWASGFYKNLAISQSEVKVVTNRKFDAENFIEICTNYQVTNVAMPPSQLAILLNSEKFLSSKIESLQTFMIVGSILPKTLRNKFFELCPSKNLMIAYGMTEGQGTMTKPMEYKEEFSVGSMIFPNCFMKIIDDDENSLENGQRGEICLKMQFKFLGYYNNPQATDAAFDKDGYVKSGDLGYFDENGMLYVIDRKKDIMKYKGYQINPSDVEDVVQSIKGVKHVSVVGISDDLCTTLLAAGVVKFEGFENLTEQDITNYVAEKLPVYKHLHGGVYFFEELPMTLSGKIQKRFVLDAIKKLKL